MDSHVVIEKYRLIYFIIDIFIVSATGGISAFLSHSRHASIRGFFCDDESIRYPLRDNTVPTISIVILSVSIPLLTMLTLELWLLLCFESVKQRRMILGKWIIREWQFRWTRYTLLFFFGMAISNIIVCVAKKTVGRLRPHFLAVCDPNITCTSTYDSQHTYYENYVCRGKNEDNVFVARKSFPSGHSAASFYSATFCVMYIERRLHWPVSAVPPKTAVQILLLAMALSTALSRVFDYMHHWGDIAVGSLIGFLVGWWWISKILRIAPDPATYPPQYNRQPA